ncbi:sugar metabolism cluster protein, partial [Vibrio paracholerae]|nr:sugar metabolism cluster protein [Vibrio paracholerae]
AGHPYVDVRASLNSFIPARLPDDLAGRIVEFCLNWLQAHPHLHDKLEFEVIPTCFSLDFDRWQQRFTTQAGLTVDEMQQWRDELLGITVNALGRNAGDMAAIERLEQRFTELKNSQLPALSKAFALLEDARRYGTLPFAHLARSAFVAVTLLRSAVATEVLSQAEVDDFLNSIRTVSHAYTQDAQACAREVLPWLTFVERYGHLRPGTYDITSPSYRQDPEHYLRPTVSRALETSDGNSGHNTAG